VTRLCPPVGGNRPLRAVTGWATPAVASPWIEPECPAPGSGFSSFVKVEIWSDVVCPWCYIGKRRFERAVERFAHRDEVQVTWRSFELDPQAPAERGVDPATHLAEKYGIARDEAVAMQARVTDLAAQEGLTYHLATARGGNTFDAHRLVQLATERGRGGDMEERLFRAYFTEGESIGDPDTLVRLADEAGLDAAEARAVLEGDAYADRVRADEQEAAAIGARGVPFFVIDRRYGVSGAQASELLLSALDQAWADAHHQ
jgi:predicted DsbA family dithiol-disulfide isomerase